MARTGGYALTRPASGNDAEDAAWLDDWLGDEASIDWFLADEERPERASRLSLIRDESAPDDGVDGRAWAGELPAVYLRRRLAVFASIVALIALGVVVRVVVVGGSSHSGSPAAAPATIAVTATPASSGVGGAKKSHAGHATAIPLQVILPVSGTIRAGDTGTAVRELQRALLKLGFDPGKADGSFGPLTQQAVIAFQRADELTADGIIGSESAAKINAALTSLKHG